MVACSLYLVPESSSTHHCLLRAVPRNLNEHYNSASDYTDFVLMLIKKGSRMCHRLFHLLLYLHPHVCYQMARNDYRNQVPSVSIQNILGYCQIKQTGRCARHEGTVGVELLVL